MKLRNVALLCAVAVLAAPALADVALVIEAQTQTREYGMIEVMWSDGTWSPDGVWTWSPDQSLPIGNTGAQFLDGVVTMYQDPDGGGRGVQPAQVNLGFSVQSGPTATDFTITSALLSFSAISNAQGRASAAWNVTDNSFPGDGATLTGNYANNKGFTTYYNGFVPGGTNFADLVDPIVAAPNSSAPGNDDFPGPGQYQPIGAPVSDMSSQISFNLTAEDLASGTTNYIVIPEPAGLVLFAVASLLIRRR